MRVPGKLSKAIFSRQKKGLNTIFLIVGPRGIGKSYLSLKLGEKYDRFFNVDHVTFDIEDFLLQVHVLQKKPYSWLVFDEIGLEVPARDFMSLVNKVMSYVSQSFRYTKVNLVTVCPDPDMVDLHVRKLSDFWILVTNRGHANVYKTKMNPFRSGSYYTPLFCDLRIPLPSTQLCDAYEEKRHAVLLQKYDEYLEEIQASKYVPQQVDWKVKAQELRTQFDKEGIPLKKWAQQIKIRLDVPHYRAYEIKAIMESLDP